MLLLNLKLKSSSTSVISLLLLSVVILIVKAAAAAAAATDYDFLDLPYKHLPYYFNSHIKTAEQCFMDEKCPHSKYLRSRQTNAEVCWGYEPYCSRKNSYWTIKCPGES